MLPSGYKYLIGLTGNGAYIDTGIVPSNTLNVEALFSCYKATGVSQATGYIFGARNSNSNTSAGQCNLYLSASGTADYVGWQSARVSSNVGSYSFSRSHFSNDANDISLVFDNKNISNMTGSTSSFTGTRNIHLFGMNNGGTHVANLVPITIFGFRMYQSGTLVRDFIPAYEEATSTSGMYDAVNNVFYTSANSTPFEILYHAEAVATTGGSAKIMTTDGSLVDDAYFTYMGALMNIYNAEPYIKFIARADEGYTFKNWTLNGNVVSTDEEYSLKRNNDFQLVANFEKMSDVVLNTGFRAMSLKYNSSSASDIRGKSYFKVLGATIKEDLLQRSTSTLECENIPSAAQINTPIFLYNPKGKIVYYGAINSIKGNTLTCREPLSIYDDDMLLSSGIYDAHSNAMNGIGLVLSFASLNGNQFSAMKKQDIAIGSPDSEMQLDTNKVLNMPMPKIDSTTVIKAEDYVYDMYNQFGIGMKYSLIMTASNYERMRVQPFYPLQQEELVIGDNLESIKNISIVTEEADCTVVDIYNSTGSTKRETYAMTTSGNIQKASNVPLANLPDFVAYSICKNKVVMSDDDLKTVAKQNLNSALYNHKITFDLMLDSLITFDDVKVGRPVRFYYGNEVYSTLISAIEYTIGVYDDTISSVKVTLGNVRTNLTSKLNLGKLQ